MLRGRRFVVPQDVFDVAPEVLRHRVTLTYDALAEGVQADDVIRAVLAPRAGAAHLAAAGRGPTAPQVLGFASAAVAGRGMTAAAAPRGRPPSPRSPRGRPSCAASSSRSCAGSTAARPATT